jgi:hypothetical protein
MGRHPAYPRTRCCTGLLVCLMPICPIQFAASSFLLRSAHASLTASAFAGRGIGHLADLGS